MNIKCEDAEHGKIYIDTLTIDSPVDWLFIKGVGFISILSKIKEEYILEESLHYSSTKESTSNDLLLFAVRCKKEEARSAIKKLLKERL